MVRISFFISIFSLILFQLLVLNCKKAPPPAPPPDNTFNFGTIKGKVLDSYNDNPVVNAIVQAKSINVSDTTNSKGEFILDSLSYGIDTLIISASHYDTSYLYIEINKDIEETINYLDKIPHYYIYAGNRGYTQIFVIDSYSATVIDTFYVPDGYGIDGRDCVILSEDGEQLIVNARPDDYTEEIKSFIFDTKTGTIIKTFTGFVMRIMPNGNFFLNSGLGDIQIINPITYDIITSDTLSIIGPTIFDEESSILYSQNPDYRLICYNYESKQLLKKYTNLKDVTDIVLSTTGKILYGTAYPYRFIAYDLETGEFLKTLSANHNGEVAIKPDGSEVLLTDPGTMLGGDPGTGKVHFFNTSTLLYGNYIELISENGYPLPSKAITIDNEGRFGYAADGSYIHFLNIQKHKLIKNMRLNPNGTTIWFLALSPNLNH